MSWKNPQYLIETEWLAAHLDDPALRVLECTTILHPLPAGGYKAESGRAADGDGVAPAAAGAAVVQLALGADQCAARPVGG